MKGYNEEMKEQTLCRFHLTDLPVPAEKKEVSDQEWRKIRELFADELKMLRQSIPRKSRFFSRIRIEPVKFSEEREVILLRTAVTERDGSFLSGAAILELEFFQFIYQNASLFSGTGRNAREENKGLLDLNRDGWLLLIGDDKTIRIYDVAEKKEKILSEECPFDFSAFLGNDRYILCRKGQTVFVISTESGAICGKEELLQEADRIYLTGDNSFAVKRGRTSALYRIEWKSAEREQ